MPHEARTGATAPRPPRIAEAMLRAALPGDLRGQTIRGILGR